METIEKDRLVREIQDLKLKYGSNRDALLPILQDLQEKYRYLPGIIMQEVAFALGIKPVEVEGVVSFYSFFRSKGKYGKYVIRLCQTVSCDLAAKKEIAEKLCQELGISFGETTKGDLFTLEYTNCLGMCDQAPALMINEHLIAKVTADQIPGIIKDCINGFEYSKFPLTVKSKVEKSGPIINHGLKNGESLSLALKLSPEKIISLIEASHLKGRGGAGFPTATKWKAASKAQGNTKYIVCNADEGEPGTFKDRYLLEQHIDVLLDGMAIAAYTIGAQKGFIYLRGEYLYLKEHIAKAIDQKTQNGYLGDSILDKPDFHFFIEIRMGAGAYICGEESALIESLEGKRGEPRNRPPFPVEKGYQSMPTVVNNVETFLDVALICAKGSDWFLKYGTDKSTGTKIFSVSGDCKRPGIYELPFGTTISELLKEVGGEGAKAVQVGGASGECVHQKDFGHRLAYEDIPSGGSIIVFGTNRDMLEVAKNFMEFFVDESCGQCTPCREGNVKLLDGIIQLQEGRCSPTHLNDLKKLANTIKISSRCGLGQTSPNPFLSILENFEDEFRRDNGNT
ncbi:MAG: NAD(P)H-dependent oxidoreductase subunit E [Leptospiraceae bacterium]|nr:NAD(P)H-dependent oxidoreductase subunit E [Leptospiraceae bacterium]MCP5493049.1 NAD(P)H-dependent oxidoreductase subunit E [Leptospiraceae bacterium]